MCDILVKEIKVRKLEVSTLPNNLCTHVLFRIKLKDGMVPNNITDGKAHVFITNNINSSQPHKEQLHIIRCSLQQSLSLTK
jgi:hypothetical protein